MLYRFNIYFFYVYPVYLIYKILSITSLSSSSSIQHTIKNSSTYVHVYEHFETIFVAFATLANTYLRTLYHSFTQIWKYTFNFIKQLSIVLETVTYYAGIMLNALLSCYAQNYSDIIDSSLEVTTVLSNMYIQHSTCTRTFL